jgi:hypothetical protein
MSYELKEYSFGQSIGKAFNLYFENFIPIVLVSIIVKIPETFFSIMQVLFLKPVSSYTNYNPAYYITLILISFGSFLFIMVGSGFLSGFITHILSKKILGKEITSGDYSTNIFPLILPIIGVSFLVGMVTVFGIVMFIAPGIIFALAFCLSTEILVIEKKSITKSMNRSWNLTKGSKGTIFAYCIVITLIILLISMPVLIITEVLKIEPVTKVIITSAVSIFTGPLSACLFVVIYFNLRVSKEGFNVEHLVNQFSLESPNENTESTAESVKISD